MSTRRPPGAGSVTRTPHGTWRVRGDMALALLDGAGEHAARIAVDLAAAVCGAQRRMEETG